VVTGAPIILFALDRDGVFTLSKGEALHLLGLKPDEVVGQSALEMYRGYPAIIDVVRRALSGESFATTSEIGDLIFEIRFQPILDDEGDFDGTVGVALDVTKRNRLQKQLLQSQKLESIGTLAGGIAHDYNNLLAVIIGNVSRLLRDRSLPEKARDILGDVMTAAERGSALSHQLLAYARGGMQQPVPTDLNRLIRSVLDILRRTAPPQIDFILKLSPELSYVMVDPTQIEQVVMNLCLNAIQASRSPSSVEISTRDVDLDRADADAHNVAPGHYVRAEVRDHGCGIDGQTLDRIFEPFFTTKPEGRGMGLSATLGIVESHGGRLHVDSTPGQGTSVVVWLPAAPDGETEIPPEKQPGAVRLPRGSETIVLVDDDSGVVQTLEGLLSSLGYVVISHTEAEKAMEFFKLHCEDIDLVLTDLNMPRHSGEAVFEQAHEYCPNAPVLLTSGFEDTALAESLLAQGAAGFISKPFTLATLAKTVRDALDGKKTPRA
jgi:PAS domain S-box-containing protein